MVTTAAARAGGASSTAQPPPEGRLCGRFRLSRGALDLDAELDVPAQGVTAVIGPSGCGKTTLLRCLAGLERAAGAAAFAGTTWQDDAAGVFVAAYRRGVGVVFQDARLFTHLSVRGNLRYALRRSALPDPGRTWDTVVQALALAPLLDRSAARLSGGEGQRVAMARAVLSGPRLLLLDEPMAALDVHRRRELGPFVWGLSRDIRLPMVYVSHALDEVLQVADTLAVMDGGRIVAAGTPADICTRPPLARYLGEELGGVLEGRVTAADPAFGLVEVQINGQRLLVPGGAADVGRRLRVHLRSRDITLATAAPDGRSSALNVLRAAVAAVHDADEAHAVLVELDCGARLLARITRRSLAALSLRPGAEVYAYVKAVVLAG